MNGSDPPKRLLERFAAEFLEVAKVYAAIARNPSLILKGVFDVCKDSLYELPKSLFLRGGTRASKWLEISVSHAVLISEVFGVMGTFLGVNVFLLIGADNYMSTIVGAALGNYFCAVISLSLSYLVLTRSVRGYTMGQALSRSLSIIRNVFPTAIAIYVSESPFQAVLICVGLPPNTATVINVVFFVALFTGVAKQVSRDVVFSQAS